MAKHFNQILDPDRTFHKDRIWIRPKYLSPKLFFLDWARGVQDTEEGVPGLRRLPGQDGRQRWDNSDSSSIN